MKCLKKVLEGCTQANDLLLIKSRLRGNLRMPLGGDTQGHDDLGAYTPNMFPVKSI